LVEGAVVGQHVVLTPDREEDTDTEKQSARLHIHILRDGNRGARACAVRDTCAKGQVGKNEDAGFTG
jgi:hypothetical protein